MPDDSRPVAVSLFKPHENCCAVATSPRAALFIDGEAYFDAFARACELAEESIVILAWDFDSRMTLRFDENGKSILTLGAFLNDLAARKPAGLRYAVFRLPDDTFVHIAMSDDGGPALTSFESFRAFQKDIRERCAEPPQPAAPVIVGNYGMLA